jgi:pimeloyl-ACP methyl ester carboxylesterase
MSAIILGNKVVHYEVLGRGKPVIFLHGWVGSWRYWIPAMQAVSSSYRAYAIDFWGFGGSAKEPSRYLISEQEYLIKTFMYELGINKIALIGHGLGAVIACTFTVHYPSLVDRFIAISMPLNMSMINPRFLNSTPAELAGWLLDNTPEAEGVRTEAPKTDQDVILRTVNNLGSINLREFSTQLSNHVLLINGANDPAISPPTSESLGLLPKNIHHIVFNQSGHFPMLDQPNKFNRLMSDFLSLESGRSPQNLQIKDEWKRRLR